MNYTQNNFCHSAQKQQWERKSEEKKTKKAVAKFFTLHANTKKINDETFILDKHFIFVVWDCVEWINVAIVIIV